MQCCIHTTHRLELASSCGMYLQCRVRKAPSIAKPRLPCTPVPVARKQCAAANVQAIGPGDSGSSSSSSSRPPQLPSALVGADDVLQVLQQPRVMLRLALGLHH